MKILVTGVTGFIGQYLSRALTQSGERVFGLSRRPAAAHLRLPWLERIYLWEATASLPPVEALSNADAVIHLAGSHLPMRLTTAKKRQIVETRQIGTRHLVQALAQTDPKPRILISASSVGYYGDHGECVITEDGSLGTGFLSSVCEIWEREAMEARSMGLRVALVRIGLVLGAGGGILSPLGRATQIGLGATFGSGQQWWPWIHMADLIGLIRYVLIHDIDGPLNGTSPQPVRQQEFVGTLGQVLHRPTLFRIPETLLKLILGELASEVLQSRKAIPYKATSTGYQFQYGQLNSALSDILLQR